MTYGPDSDLATVVGVADSYFSEYGSTEQARAALRYFRSQGVPDDEMRYIRKEAG